MSSVRKVVLVAYALCAPAIFALVWMLLRGGPWGIVIFRMPLFDWSYLGVVALSVCLATYLVADGSRLTRAIITLFYLIFVATASGLCGELLFFSIFYRDN